MIATIIGYVLTCTIAPLGFAFFIGAYRRGTRCEFVGATLSLIMGIFLVFVALMSATITGI